MELKGKVYAVDPIKSGSNWQSRQFVIEYEGGEWPKRALMEIFENDKNPGAIERAGLFIGKEVTVSFDMACRSYNDKWYGSNRVWKIATSQPAPSAPM